ncbi:MAG: DUF4270 domain-containing protein, partial [Bacteroidota bacterium]|nr:DUF4270 domain-containing protein [Bacteroidota bacterium]
MIKTKPTLAFTAFIFFSFLNWHCNKIDTTEIGSGLLPAVDNVNTFELILPVVSNNFDSSKKDCATIFPTDEHALGYIGNDPLFGKTTATIYTELKPNIFPFYFSGKPNERTLDSIVLVLSYRRTYGDSTLQQSVIVHKLLSPFKPDSSICSSYSFEAAVLGTANYKPQNFKTDTVKAIGDTSINQLRIKLSTSFGQSLLAKDTIITDS